MSLDHKLFWYLVLLTTTYYLLVWKVLSMSEEKYKTIEEAHKIFVKSLFDLARAVKMRIETEVSSVMETVTERVEELEKEIKKK